MKRVVLMLALATLALMPAAWATPCGTGDPTSCGAVSGGSTLVNSMLNQSSYYTNNTLGTAPIGSLSSWVYSGDTNNSEGGLTFVYQWDITSHDITSASFGGFFGYAFSSSDMAEFACGASCFTSTSKSYSPAGVASWQYTNAVAPFYTNYLVVYTTATISGPASASVQDGYTSAASDLVPVPEPASLLLLGTGLTGLAGLMRRRKK